MLKLVGINKEHINRFLCKFSREQEQRISIARALTIDSKFIVCDEPALALYVSVQVEVVNLLIKLQSNFNLTYLFITNDLSMLKHILDRVTVMYLGSISEVIENNEFYKNPLYLYTQSLLSAIPISDFKVLFGIKE